VGIGNLDTTLLTFYTFALAVLGIVFAVVIGETNFVLATVFVFLYFIGVALIMIRANKIRKQQIAQESERIKQEALNAEKEAQRFAEKQKSEKTAMAENLITAGRYEDAARIYDEYEMYEKAGECRRMARTSYQISTVFSMGKDGTISVNCPNCGSSQAIASKTNLVEGKHCGKNYIIPKKVLDMM
jgi:hypothetical protein